MFNSDGVGSLKIHIDQSLAMRDIHLISHDDVIVKVFVQTLVGFVDECNYVRHSLAYKPVRCGSLQRCEVFLSAYKPKRKPLRRLRGSCLRQS